MPRIKVFKKVISSEGEYRLLDERDNDIEFHNGDFIDTSDCIIDMVDS